jgi:hypothetical protein
MGGALLSESFGGSALVAKPLLASPIKPAITAAISFIWSSR